MDKLKVENLITMNQDPYPGLGAWWAQVWDGDQVVARAYGDAPNIAREIAIKIATLDDVDRLRADRDAAMAELDRAREVLRNVEWCELPHAYYGVAVRCPHCGGLRSDGHDPECPLSAALAAKGE